MSENNNIRPYLMPALRETPSSQPAVQRRPLPSSAPNRTAAQMEEAAERSRAKRAEDGKNSPSKPPTPSPAVPAEYSVATHCTIIPGHGSIYYAEDRPPPFVPTTVMHTQHVPGAYACHCHQAHTAGIAQPNMQMLPIRAPGHGYGGEQEGGTRTPGAMSQGSSWETSLRCMEASTLTTTVEGLV
ncbi:hypothetical protein DER46DRAFT_578264 [Fusarium sp. MPI-SDFR-AT-0072]|nr:hypothetical protein DER46DRAFT_578264 [Fusarium sp. MPI-SDFR-AT-0072]